MRARYSRAPRRGAALGAAFASLLAAGCAAPDERDRGTYDPRGPVVECLRDDGVPARLAGRAAIDAEGVRIDFLATPGEAEARQIQGRAQGAEQIGRALIWVGRASDDLLETIEGCVDR
jgi:hypothetical protein